MAKSLSKEQDACIAEISRLCNEIKSSLARAVELDLRVEFTISPKEAKVVAFRKVD